jgi:hypothetical protein
MNKAYEYADVIQRKIEGHLKSLGYNVQKPKEFISLEHKLSVLNYLRAIKTPVDIVQEAVMDTPLLEHQQNKLVSMEACLRSSIADANMNGKRPTS